MPFNLDKQLPKETFDKIISYCVAGDLYLEKKQHDQALENYTNALSVIPSPKEIWHAYIWLLWALAETHFLKTDFQNAQSFYQRINETTDPEKIDPLIHLRLAQCHFKLGKINEADRDLKKSLVPYDLSELENPIYWEIIRGVSIRDDSLPFNTLA